MLIGMSQERLGEILGVTFQQVQKYEKGINRIGAGRLQDISEALGVPITYFYGDVADVDSESAGGPGDLLATVLGSPESIRVSRAFAAIGNPRIRRQVVELLEVLSDSDPQK
jgi:transcriptional regulator with XRE-family HTH domain